MKFPTGPLASLLYSVAISAASGLSYAQESQDPAAQSNSSSEAREGKKGDKVEEVIVMGSRRGNFNIITEDAQKLVDMPGALGDPIAAVFSLPGVVSDGGKPAVRGSSPEDNRYYTDFMPSGYVFHTFLGSVFSEFILQDFQLYSAGFGPEYSDVTGAVFDIGLRDPKNQKLGGVIDLSMLRSGLFVEGAVTEKSAFYLSYRQSLIHLFIPEGEEEDGIIIQDAPQEGDYQLKYVYELNDEHSIQFLASGATDLAAAELTRESDFVRSNPDFVGDSKIEDIYNGQSLVWRFDGDNSSAKLGLGHHVTEYDLDWGDDFFFNYKLTQETLRGRYAYNFGDSHEVTIGGLFAKQKYDIRYDQVFFICTEFEADCLLNRVRRISDSPTIESDERSLFLNETWRVSDALTFDVGVQWQENDYTDESFVHPRISAHWSVNDSWSVFAKHGKYNRFPNVAQILPMRGNPDLKSPRSTHSTFGVEQLLDNGWSWTAEIYHKKLSQLPLGLSADDADAALLYSNDVDGTANGIEFFINKELTDRWYGWIALSYAESKRKNLRTDQSIDYHLDTPLIFNWVTNYQWNEMFNIGWRWSVRSGGAYTPIIGVQDNPFFEDSVIPVYDEPYSDRLPIYSRLDIRFKWDFMIHKWDSAVILDIVNALNQHNVEDRTLDYDKVDSADDRVQTEDSVSFGIIPAITFRMRF